MIPMDVNDKIHAQLVKAGVRLAASLPDDWLNGLIRRVARDDAMRTSRSAAKPKPSPSAPARSSAACARPPLSATLGC